LSNRESDDHRQLLGTVRAAAVAEVWALLSHVIFVHVLYAHRQDVAAPHGRSRVDPTMYPAILLRVVSIQDDVVAIDGLDTQLAFATLPSPMRLELHEAQVASESPDLLNLRVGISVVATYSF